MKIIEIENCGQCSHCGTDIDVEMACKILDIETLGRKIPRGYYSMECTIPPWCPLPDKIGYTHKEVIHD